MSVCLYTALQRNRIRSTLYIRTHFKGRIVYDKMYQCEKMCRHGRSTLIVAIIGKVCQCDKVCYPPPPPKNLKDPFPCIFYCIYQIMIVAYVSLKHHIKKSGVEIK
jgi:hypothetical protein